MSDPGREHWWETLKFTARDVISLAVILVSMAGAWFTLSAKVDSIERDRIRDRYEYHKAVKEARDQVKEMKEDSLRTIDRIEKQVTRIEDRLLTWPRTAP